MKLPRATTAQIIATATSNRDLADAELLEVEVAGTWYPCTWTGAAVSRTTSRGTRWTRPAITDAFFAGPDAPTPGDAIQLADDEPTRSRTTWPDGTTAIEPASTIEIPS